MERTLIEKVGVRKPLIFTGTAFLFGVFPLAFSLLAKFLAFIQDCSLLEGSIDHVPLYQSFNCPQFGLASILSIIGNFAIITILLAFPFFLGGLLVIIIRLLKSSLRGI